MIANMSKYTFLIHHLEYTAFLETLRHAGVVHVKEKAEGIPDEPEIAEKLSRIKEIEETIKYLKSRKVAESDLNNMRSAEEIIKRVHYLRLQTDLKNADILAMNKKVKQLQPWGDFSHELMQKLVDAGQILHFFSCNKSNFKEAWKQQFNLFEINRVGSVIYFVVHSNSEERPAIDAEPIRLPEESSAQLNKEIKRVENELDSIANEINELAASGVQVLENHKQNHKQELDFKTVSLQSTDQADARLKLLEGWVPEDNETALEAILKESGAYYVKSKPGRKDNVPVLLKNNAFTKLFEVVGSLYSLPSYREIDLTPFFAPFFMLFFGFCLGDAGYGLLMLVVTLILRAKAKPDMKPVWSLGALFGISTVIMGLLGGTIFGVMLIDLNFNWLETFQSIILNQDQLMYFSVVLGIIQIVFGMCLKAARAIKIDGIKYALSTIGWVIIIVGVGIPFALAKGEYMGAELSKYLMMGFGGLGAILALFFNSPGKNIFLNFGLGLWDAYGTVTGLLGDVLSYIRLFALGLSSAVLGSVFNQLAFNLTGDIPVLSVIFTILILLVGHAINFFMAALGSFVHPLRLTFVEFYKNTGFEGGGKKYTPFKRA